MTLPRDPFILLSYINTELRDNFDSLDALIDAQDIDKEILLTTLSDIGYTYNSELNRFC